MSLRLSGKSIWFVLLALALAGCFRQASPDVVPPTNEAVPTILQTLLPPAEGAATPFVTPFAPGQGPDVTRMPTVGAPSPTLALVAPASTGEDFGILSPASPTSAVTNTIPFAAGATYTPLPGAPPVNLNPNVRPTSTPALGESGGPQEDDPCTYTVQAGDTAFYIATIHGLTLVELIEANGLENADYLYEGQVLQIPGCGEGAATSEPGGGQPSAPTTVPGESAQPGASPQAPPGTTIHVVQAGENLFRISLRYGVTVEDIVAANNLGSADAILRVGQELIIPTP